MKLVSFLFTLFFIYQLNAQVEYVKYFSDNQIRFSYTIYGNSSECQIDSPVFYKEPTWGGSRTNLIDTFMYGEFFLKIFQAETNELIYSRGFSDLFIEWQLTKYAEDSIKYFNECIIFPMPLEKVKVEMLKRDKQNKFYALYTKILDPQEVVKPEVVIDRYEKSIHKSGHSSQKLDIVFISEGYTSNQKAKFFNDAHRFKKYLFSSPAYADFKDKINITAVFIPSMDEGVDIPVDSIFVHTVLDAHFGTFGIDRYLTLPNQDKIFSFLSGIPCEQACVLVNSSKYGGGGIFNHYNIFTVDNVRSGSVFLHEFGHGFASLADEYFNSEVPYEKTDSIMFEPYEPNVTALIGFESKWGNLVHDTIPVPTPDITGYDGVVGAFEGARYLSKGYYRSERNCMMRALGANRFCFVCKRAIQNMVLFYAE